MTVLGIDVSHHNGAIDWPLVGQSDVRFAFAKATDGSTFVDPRFTANWPAIRDAGLLRGAYHFGRPGSDPEVQASHFASVVGPLSWGELPPALDLEVMDGQSKQAVIDWTLAFLGRAELLLGCPLIVYTGGLWRHQLGGPNVQALATHLLWTARYGSAPPIVPPPWKEWSFWQFTDGRSGQVRQISGVPGACDCDWYGGDAADLQSLSDGVGGGTPAPPPPEPPPTPGNAWPGRVFVWPSTPTVRGKDVSTWQARILARGFAVTTDGIYGPESKAACLAFQRHAGLDPDGIVGRRTWEATFDRGNLETVAVTSSPRRRKRK
jgi:lysozyme